MRGLCLALLTSIVHGAEDLHGLRWMAQHAAWGAANDNKYGKDFGEQEAHDADRIRHLDELNAALEDATVVKHLDAMSTNAAWAAANERAYGKKRAGSQVDWDMYRLKAQSMRESLTADFGEAIEKAAADIAWYAANKYSLGSGDKDTMASLDSFTSRMALAKKSAPEKWPMKNVEALLKANAFSAASHRAADLMDRKKQRSHGVHYEEQETRQDWKDYKENALLLEKALGAEHEELFQHFDGMCQEAAWGAANERRHGAHSNNAQVHWKKYFFHEREAEPLYKGAKWGSITQMIRSAAWGAANERAYGANSDDAKDAWARFHTAVAAVVPTNGGEL